jgi:hypothetical protein
MRRIAICISPTLRANADAIESAEFARGRNPLILVIGEDPSAFEHATKSEDIIASADEVLAFLDVAVKEPADGFAEIRHAHALEIPVGVVYMAARRPRVRSRVRTVGPLCAAALLAAGTLAVVDHRGQRKGVTVAAKAISVGVAVNLTAALLMDARQARRDRLDSRRLIDETRAA